MTQLDIYHFMFFFVPQKILIRNFLFLTLLFTSITTSESP